MTTGQRIDEIIKSWNITLINGGQNLKANPSAEQRRARDFKEVCGFIATNKSQFIAHLRAEAEATALDDFNAEVYAFERAFYAVGSDL